MDARGGFEGKAAAEGGSFEQCRKRAYTYTHTHTHTHTPTETSQQLILRDLISILNRNTLLLIEI